MNPATLILLVLPMAAPSPQVYKCTDNAGTVVYSQRPCADDPAKVETVDTSRALRTGSGGSVAEQGEFADLNAVRRDCDGRLNGISARYDSQRRRTAAEIEALERQAAQANNNLAGATYDAGIRQQIAGLLTERGALQQAEATERTAAREQCDSEIKATEARITAARAQRQAAAEATAEAARERQARDAESAAKEPE